MKDYTNTPAKSKLPTWKDSIQKDRRLPHWEPPRSKTQAMARLRNGMREWASHTYDNLYKWGGILDWLTDPVRCEHGERLQVYAALDLKPRTAENWKRFHRECKDNNRMVTPHWIRGRGKNATVALLAAPEGPEEAATKIKKQKPEHDSEPLNWSTSDEVEALRGIFFKRNGRRKIEEMEDVAERLSEALREGIEERREIRLALRGEEEDES